MSKYSEEFKEKNVKKMIFIPDFQLIIDISREINICRSTLKKIRRSGWERDACRRVEIT